MDQATRFYVLFGPIVLMVVLAVLLRWTFGTGRNQPGPRVVDPDDPTGDGLLEEISRVPTEAAAQILRGRLRTAGIRATVARDGPAYRLLVFTSDVPDARVVLSSGAIE